MEGDNKIGMHAGAKPEIFQFARSLRAKMTGPEKKLWDYLKLKPLGFKFRRQHPYNIYILDFYCHKAKLAIEIDGKNHESPNQKKVDKTRTKTINYYGVKELRFTNEEVIGRFENVKTKILTFLETNPGSLDSL